jgi:hypothetical protein
LTYIEAVGQSPSPIKISAHAYIVNANQFHNVVNMIDGICDGGYRAIA